MVKFSKESTNRSDPVLPNELVWEILTWLPVKSLMRFKCVSKLWQSVIVEPAFATRHRRRGAFRGLLIFGSSLYRRYNETDFFSIRLDGPSKEISYYLNVDHGCKFMRFTDPVNGLICFYYRNHSFLYNLATRESLQLPDSVDESQACTYHLNSVDEYQTCTYHLGFDPLNNLYKLMKICPVYTNYDEGHPLADDENYRDCYFVSNLNCEVLTIGGSVKDSPFLWRSIDSPPWDLDSSPWNMRSRSVCYDGVIYWCELREGIDGEMDHLIAFDLSKENFFTIAMPSCGFYLSQFGPGLCVFKRMFVEGASVAKIISYHGGGTVPTELDISVEAINFFPIGVLPEDGKVLFSDYLHSYFPPAVFYLYDPKKGGSERIVIPQVTPSPFIGSMCSDLLGSLFVFGCKSYFEENIVSLKALDLTSSIASLV